MTEDRWHQARLIPTTGINGADEQERRVTSALLAVIGGVPEFGRAVTAPLGAPVGPIETFTEVVFRNSDRKCIPHGLIRVRSAAGSWTALVVVRTGAAGLDVALVRTVLDVADEQGFDVVLTISNQAAGGPPIDVDGLRPGRARLQHHAWSRVLAEAVTQREHRGVSDPDQAWVLGELIRYLEDPRSGAPKSGAPPRAETVYQVDLRDPQVTVLHTVVVAEPEPEPEPAARPAPSLPSRRDVRLVRRLGADDGTAAGGSDAGWYQDPDESTQLRWWDGVSWTSCTYPAQPALA